MVNTLKKFFALNLPHEVIVKIGYWIGASVQSTFGTALSFLRLFALP